MGHYQCTMESLLSESLWSYIYPGSHFVNQHLPKWVVYDLGGCWGILNTKSKRKEIDWDIVLNFQGAWDQEMAWECSQLRTSVPFNCILKTTFCYFYLLCMWIISNLDVTFKTLLNLTHALPFRNYHMSYAFYAGHTGLPAISWTFPFLKFSSPTNSSYLLPPFLYWFFSINMLQ